MESACRWTSLEVVEYLTNKTSCQKEISKENEENDLPPVAFLGINDDKTINVNKQILYNFQYMFDEMLDSDGNRLIHIFVLNNRILQTRALLEIDPSLANCKSRIGLLPLDLVSDQFNLKLHLLRFNARHTLHGVARLGYISAAEEIIFNDSNAVHCINAFGESPLHVAAIFGQTKMIQVKCFHCVLKEMSDEFTRKLVFVWQAVPRL